MLACNATRLFSALVTVGIICLVSPAGAQQQQDSANAPTPPPMAVGSTGWRVECGNTGQALECRTFIDAVDSNKRQVIGSISMRYSADTKKTVIGIQLPLGILVTQPVAVSVDAAPPENFAIETCKPQGCFAGSPISDATIAKMRTGKEIKLVFYNVNKQPITLSMPLAGFALAFDKTRS